MRPTALLIPFLALAHCSAAEETPMSDQKPYQFAMIETIASSGLRPTYVVNGFPTDALTSLESTDGVSSSFATTMEECLVLHPYFLRPGENVVSAAFRADPHATEDAPEGSAAAGRGPLVWRMAAVTFPVTLEDWGQKYKDRELARFDMPALPADGAAAKLRTVDGTFVWKQRMPTWSWTHGVTIDRSPTTCDSLYAEYVKFHAALAGLAGTKEPSAFIDGLRGSMAEFIAASELRAKPYRLIDDLAYAARNLSTRDYDELEARRAAEPKPKDVPIEIHAIHDGTPVDDTPPGPDGKMPPRISLEALPPRDALTLTIFGRGSLAKLSTAEGEPLIGFYNNYLGGRWGSERHTPSLRVEVWFRRQVDGAWVVDGLWAFNGSVRTMAWGGLSDLMTSDNMWGAE